MSGDICCNIEIKHNRRRYLETEHVYLHVLGSNGGVWMTPDEARRLAALLERHANMADGQESP